MVTVNPSPTLSFEKHIFSRVGKFFGSFDDGLNNKMLKKNPSFVSKLFVIIRFNRNYDFYTVSFSCWLATQFRNLTNLRRVNESIVRAFDSINIRVNNEVVSVSKSRLWADAQHTSLLIGVALGGLTVECVNILNLFIGQSLTEIPDHKVRVHRVG